MHSQIFIAVQTRKLFISRILKLTFLVENILLYTLDSIFHVFCFKLLWFRFASKQIENSAILKQIINIISLVEDV